MARPGSVMLVCLLDASQPHFQRRHWPPHSTLIPWFELPSSQKESAVWNDLHNLARTIPAFSVTVGGEASLGAAHTTVNVIDSDELQNLHAQLKTFLTERGVALPLERDVFTPHITRRDADYAFDEGLDLSIVNFYAIRLLTADTCEVIERFRLRGEA